MIALPTLREVLIYGEWNIEKVAMTLGTQRLEKAQRRPCQTLDIYRCNQCWGEYACVDGNSSNDNFFPDPTTIVYTCKTLVEITLAALPCLNITLNFYSGFW